MIVNRTNTREDMRREGSTMAKFLMFLKIILISFEYFGILN
jgi:hypothetical protein